MESSYFQFTRESEDPAARLFCFHCAGGSPYAYAPWEKFIDPRIDIFPFQMSGRCGRKRECYASSIEAAALEAAEQIKDCADRKIYLTGHSMGGVVAHYTAYLLKQLYGIRTEKLFITASVPDLGSSIRDNYGSTDRYDDNRFCEMLLGFGAVDSKIIRIRQFREQFLPIIRSDFTLIGNYHADPTNVIDSNISVFCGDCDKIVSRAACCEWKKYTKGKVDITELSGGHFFINEHVKEICGEINRCVS